MDDEVIRDPLRERTTYWGGIWMAIGFAVGGVVAWWLGGLVGGVARVLIRIVAVLAGAYAAYLVAIVAFMSGAIRLFSRWLRRTSVRDAASEGQVAAFLRVPTDDMDEPRWSNQLFDALDDDTEGIECGTLSSGAGLVEFTVTGPSRDAVLARIRSVARSVPLPADAYIWIPESADDGTGRRYAL